MLAFMGLGPSEVLMVFVVVLLFFGGRKIPELARALRSPLPEVAQAAANLLGEIGGRTALLALMAADRGETESEILATVVGDAEEAREHRAWEAAVPQEPVQVTWD